MKIIPSFTPFLQPISRSHQRFTDVPELHPIPSNCIIDKTLTGFGATYSEISYAGRNSIIVMPNVALIISKSRKHSEEFNTYGVWGSISIAQIKRELNRPIFPKKILTTPESLERVLTAIRATGANPERDYFLLIDESHKITKDVGYRQLITSHMDTFFTFKNKSVISATPISPSDPRFKKHRFKYVKVDPDYDYRQCLDVVHVNNILRALETYFNDNKERHYFIFFTSIIGIKNIIERFSIKDESAVFSSIESTDNLRAEGFTNANNELNDFKKYNFFTSSFYNGVDIVPSEPVDIIMISNPQTANSLHTLIDPLTDSIQIIGRFRKVYRKATHFFTTNWKIGALDNKEAISWIQTQRKCYEAVKALCIANPNAGKDSFEANIYKQTLNRMYYSRFLKNDVTDYYKIDNYLSEERVKSYYRHPSFLESAYKGCHRALKVNFKNYELIVGEVDRLKIREGRRYSIEKNKIVANTLRNLLGKEHTDEYKEIIRHFEQKAFYMVQAFFKLGFNAMAEVGFRTREIEKLVLKADFESKRNIYPVFDAIHSKLALNIFYPATQRILPIITDVYNLFEISQIPRPCHVNYFFECQSTTKKYKGKATKGYILTERRHLPFPEYQRN